MTMKTQKFVNIAMILLAWVTLPFVGAKNIKRFLPASLLILLIEEINCILGKSRKWWYFYNKPKSHFFGEFPFYIGPFFVSTFWVLKWTYGHFAKFCLLNMIINAFFAFPLEAFSRKIKYFTLVRINRFQFFIYYFYKALLLYWFQYLFEKNYSLKNPSSSPS